MPGDVSLTSYWLQRQIKSAENCVFKGRVISLEISSKEKNRHKYKSALERKSHKKISHGDF